MDKQTVSAIEQAKKVLGEARDWISTYNTPLSAWMVSRIEAARANLESAAIDEAISRARAATASADEIQAAERCDRCADPVDLVGYSWLICEKCGRHYSPRPAYAPPMDQITEAERRGYARAIGEVFDSDPEEQKKGVVK